jgi:hypothetical protein
MRELDHRSSDDIEVTLLWSARTNRVFVSVLERRTEALFRFEVARTDALGAFHHPYAYANTSSSRTRSPPEPPPIRLPTAEPGTS